MASLTESFHLSNIITNKSNLPPPNNNDWYDSIYLCIQNSSLERPLIDGFKCFKFSNFNEADDYFNKLKNLNIENRLQYLSMGMSSDYVEALKSGSDFIRVGSAIFSVI